MSSSTWSTIQAEMLADGWRGGRSSGEIARALGVSRAAVANKRKRMGLPSRAGVIAEVAMRVTGKRNLMHGVQVKTQTRRDRASAPLAGSSPRLWEQRLAGECCFPVGGAGADTLSCCLPVTVEGGWYCAGHQAILHPPAA
jgi:hypothetical protein